jgi:hypothetical protein
MSTAAVTKLAREPRSMARTAGFCYPLTFATGIFARLVHNRLTMIAGLLAGMCYVVVTNLFYFIFIRRNRRLALTATVLSLAGCAVGPLIQVHLLSAKINPLAFFGVYCLLVGYLILRSTFLPRMLGVGMLFAGLSWLTFFSLQLANSLFPYNLFPGIVAKGALTLWLVVRGVDERRWREQFSRGSASP